jgi:guanylate kinase
MEDMTYLENLIANYRPSSKAIDVVNSTTLVLMAGVAGAGKDTIKHEILKTGQFHHLVSHTTRAPRLNNGQMEINGQDYHFISLDQARQMLEQQEFIEAKFVHGRIYGTSLMEVERALAEHTLPMTDVDVQGVAEYCAISQQVVPIFVLPPSYETWLARLKGRYASAEEFEAEWPRRRQSAESELQSALDNPRYFFLVNDDLTQAVQTAHQLIAGQIDQDAQQHARQIAQQLLMQLQQIDTEAQAMTTGN